MHFKLDKKRAYRLVTPIVDGEASEQEKRAFFEFIAKNPDVRRYFEEEQWIKKLVRERVRQEPLPPGLKIKIDRCIRDQALEERFHQRNGFQACLVDSKGSNYKKITIVTIAAAIIISIFLYLFLLQNSELSNEGTQQELMPGLEEMAMAYYTTLGSGWEFLDISTASSAEVKASVQQHFGFDLRIPELSRAELTGVADLEFMPGFHTPMFEYHVHDAGVIYIFAFVISDIDDRMERDQNAVDYCVTKYDYYIHTRNGQEMVSWKWDDVWYVGISGQNGETLAGLLPQSP